MSRLHCIVRYFLLLLLFSSTAQAAGIIEDIRFEGNDVTQESVMREEMVVTEGDAVVIERIEWSVQYIMNLGIFERVSYRTEPAETPDNIILIITVIERYYIIPLPTAKLDGDNQLEYGVKLRWNNVAGLNHRLRLDLINKGTDLGVNEFHHKLEYAMPRIFSSRYAVSLKIENEVGADDDPINGQQRQQSYGIGFDVLKWLGDDGVSKGLFASGGASYRVKEITALNIPLAPDQKLDAVIYTAGIGYSDITEYEFNREGAFLQYRIEFSGDDSPGFNQPYTKYEINYTHLHSYSNLEPLNFNYNIDIGSSNNDVLGDKAFSLGGNTDLRGYSTGAYRGNAFLRVNLEYLSVFDESPLLRKVYFIDFGDAQESLGDIRFSTLKTGVGAGLRWKLRRFVDLDLRVDLAYGVENRDFRFGLGTRSTF
ncbi:MAG: BamA/TamA family outer membrane protein [Gammaproteobacteria bacterium]